ncbi:hypothetical protein Lqui_2502 [Legionella quinlivanii]|uniref:Uncharacterized protein n=1 Tax=Legionella quinlivanii TaxID=45073 RepID=A0A0W0XP79_9GAMM|nr:hypothetical protein [Legionella quinlivanii]KTD46577.1 hypothetical protein Lqui_2502 [Legionella quinlivanii]SEG08882.1 hypothetical protein SAMN02746093_01826 [Legionella quinlivanii DSM 21216]STY10266.1 Uncharacterised protein [Legionella quinlivanii]
MINLHKYDILIIQFLADYQVQKQLVNFDQSERLAEQLVNSQDDKTLLSIYIKEWCEELLRINEIDRALFLESWKNLTTNTTLFNTQQIICAIRFFRLFQNESFKNCSAFFNRLNLEKQVEQYWDKTLGLSPKKDFEFNKTKTDSSEEIQKQIANDSREARDSHLRFILASKLPFYGQSKLPDLANNPEEQPLHNTI